jgi:hypothetical protein
MKKAIGIIVLGLLWCNVGFAGESFLETVTFNDKKYYPRVSDQADYKIIQFMDENKLVRYSKYISKKFMRIVYSDYESPIPSTYSLTGRSNLLGYQLTKPEYYYVYKEFKELIQMFLKRNKKPYGLQFGVIVMKDQPDIKHYVALDYETQKHAMYLHSHESAPSSDINLSEEDRWNYLKLAKKYYKTAQNAKITVDKLIALTQQ